MAHSTPQECDPMVAVLSRKVVQPRIIPGNMIDKLGARYRAAYSRNRVAHSPPAIVSTVHGASLAGRTWNRVSSELAESHQCIRNSAIAERLFPSSWKLDGAENTDPRPMQLACQSSATSTFLAVAIDGGASRAQTANFASGPPSARTINRIFRVYGVR
ncbi:hypothetical protein B0H14DRAFT_2655429 [Mycena olivaceomarginata]|nr:hypothetical protein B0H14DRAFT_2655429 [Mycena olivaceomarginata]